MQLLLIRHAQSVNNALPEEQRVEDPPLTELGQLQAAALGRHLAGAELQYLVSSPFLRALQTAEHIRKGAGLVPQVWTDLHEVGGCYAGYDPPLGCEGRPGMSRRQIEAAYPGYVIEDPIGEQGWWCSQPYEPEMAARQRARRLLQRTLQTFGPRAATVGFVMHADFKRIFLGELFAPHGVPESRWSGIFNTSVSVIRFHGSAPELVEFNSTAHLHSELLSHPA